MYASEQSINSPRCADQRQLPILGQPLGAIQISLGSAQLILCFLMTAYRLLEFGVAPFEFLDLQHQFSTGPGRLPRGPRKARQNWITDRITRIPHGPLAPKSEKNPYRPIGEIPPGIEQ